jgi:hypothetical protein
MILPEIVNNIGFIEFMQYNAAFYTQVWFYSHLHSYCHIIILRNINF